MYIRESKLHIYTTLDLSAIWFQIQFQFKSAQYGLVFSRVYKKYLYQIAISRIIQKKKQLLILALEV